MKNLSHMAFIVLLLAACSKDKDDSSSGTGTTGTTSTTSTTSSTGTPPPPLDTAKTFEKDWKITKEYVDGKPAQTAFYKNTIYNINKDKSFKASIPSFSTINGTWEYLGTKNSIKFYVTGSAKTFEWTILKINDSLMTVEQPEDPYMWKFELIKQ